MYNLFLAKLFACLSFSFSFTIPPALPSERGLKKQVDGCRYKFTSHTFHRRTHYWFLQDDWQCASTTDWSHNDPSTSAHLCLWRPSAIHPTDIQPSLYSVAQDEGMEDCAATKHTTYASLFSFCRLPRTKKPDPHLRRHGGQEERKRSRGAGGIGRFGVSEHSDYGLGIPCACQRSAPTEPSVRTCLFLDQGQVHCYWRTRCQQPVLARHAHFWHQEGIVVCSTLIEAAPIWRLSFSCSRRNTNRAHSAFCANPGFALRRLWRNTGSSRGSSGYQHTCVLQL